MEAKATAKYLRVSPIKVKRVASLVRGKDLGEAINILKLTGNKPAREIEKVVKSAAANAENKDGKQMTVFDKISTGKNEEEMITNRMVVNQLINELEDRDKEIILLRFFKEKTQTEVAKILGISQVQVSRIERKILNNMKTKLTSA